VSEERDIAVLIRQLEDERYAAMTGKDIATLDRLLDDNLTYMHSSGITDTRASYLEGLQTGVWDYEQIDRTDYQATVERELALVFCKLSIRMVIRGVFKAFDSRALAVWVRRSDGWRLLAVHSGAVAPRAESGLTG
jgi:hypothetical protein